jgi:hypothetical protein
MSYCRFSHADVYVYMDVGGYLNCCGCILQEREWVDDPTRPIFKGYLKAVGPEVQSKFHDTQGMVDHLALHVAAGHDVPDDVIPALWDDDAENFPGSCAEGHVWGDPFHPYPDTFPSLQRAKCVDCDWLTSWPASLPTRAVKP